jgi:hypothetical protein
MCLSEDEINKLVKFVEGGGGLVLTGNSGDYNELYCGWDDQSLKARLGISDKRAPYSAGIGMGRVASFPRLTSEHDFNTYDWAYRAFEQAQLWVKHHSWEAPDNMREIADAIRWTLKDELPVTVNAPEPVVCELMQSGSSLYLHLLNYDNDNTARAITVTFGQKIKSAMLVVPQTGDSKELKISAANSVVVDKLDTYAIIKVTV